MRISELAEQSGVPLPTIKYYLREGLLMPGTATSATRATYDDDHVRRLALIRALIDVAGLPVAKVRTIVAVLEDPGPSLFEALGKAIEALPPYDVERRAEHRRARHALDLLGQNYEPGSAAVAHLESALAGLESAGRPLRDDRLLEYGRQVRAIAEGEIATMTVDRAEDALEHAVLGTVLHEPLILALRRLAHQDLYLARSSAG